MNKRVTEEQSVSLGLNTSSREILRNPGDSARTCKTWPNMETISRAQQLRKITAS